MADIEKAREFIGNGIDLIEGWPEIDEDSRLLKEGTIEVLREAFTILDEKPVVIDRQGKNVPDQPCPDCQQPPDPDREFVKEVKGYLNRLAGKVTSGTENKDDWKGLVAFLYQACNYLDAQQPASEFTKELRAMIVNARCFAQPKSTLYDLCIEGHKACGLLDAQQQKIDRQNKEHKQLHEDCAAWMDKAHEAESECGKLKSELSLYCKNFCEAHQPLPDDSYEGCYCCDMVQQAKEIERLKEQLIVPKCETCTLNPKPKYTRA